MQARTFLMVAAAVSLVACGSDSSATGPQNTLNGSMSATVDGAPWTATVAVQGAFQNGILAMSGVAGDNTIIALAIAPTGPGTYEIALTQPTNASYTVPGGQALAWQAAATQGSGSVVLQTLTATEATGTFQFELPAVTTTGATGTKIITNGKFDVKF